MTAPAVPVSINSSVLSPTLRLLSLSEAEQTELDGLQRRLFDQRGQLQLLDAYYNGEQQMTTLGISLPPELEGLRTVLGWPRLAVDPLHERLDVDGFRFPDADDADQGMWEIWQRNDLDTEAPMGWLDALIFGTSYIMVGTDDDSDVPLVTVESPMNMSVRWDPRRRTVRSAVQVYSDEDGRSYATLALPDQTIDLASNERGEWEISNRDQHRLGAVPVLRMANRSRVHDRRGRSEITPELRTVTDAAIRALLRMEVGAEFFSTPQRYAIGASMQDFQDADGNMMSAWETYIGRYLMMERDEEGNAPVVGQFAPSDPSAHTKVLDKYAELAASIMGLDGSYLGMSTDNPASADAIRMTTDRLVQKAKRKQRGFESAIEGAMRFALAFQQGEVPDSAQMIETLWRAPEIPTPGATSDAICKQIETGYLPADSDVAGAKLGYTVVERRQVAADRKRAQADQSAQALLARAVPATQQPHATASGPTSNPSTSRTPAAKMRPAPGAQERAQGDQQARGTTQS